MAVLLKSIAYREKKNPTKPSNSIHIAKNNLATFYPKNFRKRPLFLSFDGYSKERKDLHAPLSQCSQVI